MEKIDLSIIIASYNNARLLEACLDSVYKNTQNINFEIIVVDNHSSDNAVEVVRSKFPQVKLIQNQENLGFCKANNQGLEIYRGRYALLLNTDTIVKEKAFERMVEFMDNHAEAGVCGPLLLNPDGAPQHQGGMFARKFWLSKLPVKVDYVLGACLMVKRKVVEKVGGLDENFFFSNDDLDWCRRIRKAGWVVYFVPQAKVIHCGGFTTKHFSQKTFVEGFRGGLYFCRKHYGSFIYQTYRCLLSLGLILLIITSTLLYPLLTNKKKLSAYWRILMIALSPLPMGEGNKRGEGKSILLISNGHAEDLAAAAIGAGLKEVKVRALPLVGLGKAYDEKGIENLGLGKVVPSGGFAKEGLGYFMQDLLAGLGGLLFQQIRILRKERERADLVVCVGDVFLVALCGFFTRKPIIFIDGPNSIRIRDYYPIEKWILRKFCKKVIVQDRETAEAARKSGIPACYLGTWVMDYINITGEDFGIDKSKTVIGILPGTRTEAYKNLSLILKVLEIMSRKNQNLVGLIASALDRKKVEKIISLSKLNVLLAEGKFGDVCKQSKLIIGLAGIANEQAVGLGTPVVAFPGHGPQTTLRRWKEIHKITGDSMAILTGTADEIAQRILDILKDTKRLEEMRQIGLESKKEKGGITQIINLIIKVL